MPELAQALALIRCSAWLFQAFGVLARKYRDLAELAQRFPGHHRGGKRDVETATSAFHWNDEPGVGVVVDLIWDAGGFAAEEQDIAVGELELRVGQGRSGREQHKPAAFAPPPLLEAREVDVPGKLRHFEIVHAGAPEIAVGNIEAGGLDDVDGYTEAGGHAQYGAGVAGDVRLVERDADALAQYLASLNCCRMATVRWDLQKKRFTAVAILRECGYRAGIVNTNRRRQAWYICLSHFAPAELAGLRPDGGFGSTLFLTFQSFIVSIPAGIFSRYPKESSDVFQSAARAEKPV